MASWSSRHLTKWSPPTLRSLLGWRCSTSSRTKVSQSYSRCRRKISSKCDSPGACWRFPSLPPPPLLWRANQDGCHHRQSQPPRSFNLYYQTDLQPQMSTHCWRTANRKCWRRVWCWAWETGTLSYLGSPLYLSTLRRWLITRRHLSRRWRVMLRRVWRWVNSYAQRKPLQIL